jgi:hypothetical protein
VVGGSTKRRDMIRDINHEQVKQALGYGQLETRTGLNQEQCLQRPRHTRWSSHYKTLKSLLNMFPTIVEVLKVVKRMIEIGKIEIKHQIFWYISNLLTLPFICISC